MEELNYTTIHHNARITLDLSMNDYALCDLVYHLSNNPEAEIKGWCYASKNRIGELLGLSKQSIHSMINNLIDKGLIERQKETKHLRTTPLWYKTAVIRQTESKDTLPPVKILYHESKESLPQDSKDSLPNNNIYKNNIKNNKNTVTPKAVTSYSDNLNKYIETFNTLFNSSYQATNGRDEKLRLRLKTYTLDQVLVALTNLSRSSFHRGKNERSWVADPDFLIKNDEQVDKWLNSSTEKRTRVPYVSLAQMVKQAQGYE